MSPPEVLTDFELTIIQAIELAFPTTEVKGCFFHFAPTINRKIANMAGGQFLPSPMECDSCDSIMSGY